MSSPTNPFSREIPSILPCLFRFGSDPVFRDFSRSFRSTSSGTRSRTLPPSMKTSLTRLELRKENSWLGIMNRVSISGASLRFMRAIWNSYSKSEMALRPRMTVLVPLALANSTRRPLKDTTSTSLRPSKICRIMATLSLVVNRGSFLGFSRTATRIRSKIFSPRWMISTCPLVMGSKEPGIDSFVLHQKTFILVPPSKLHY